MVGDGRDREPQKSSDKGRKGGRDGEGRQGRERMEGMRETDMMRETWREGQAARGKQEGVMGYYSSLRHSLRRVRTRNLLVKPTIM